MNNAISLIVSYKLLRIKSNPGIIKFKEFLNVSAKITNATKEIITTTKKLKVLIFLFILFFFTFGMVVSASDIKSSVT